MNFASKKDIRGYVSGLKDKVDTGFDSLSPEEKDEGIRNLLSIVDIFLLPRKNSKNSHTPCSQDQNRERGSKDSDSDDEPKRSIGGQPGHKGHHLEPFENPDETIKLKLDHSKVPPGKNLRLKGCCKRQVVEVQISKKVVQYEAEIWVDEDGTEYLADFPKGVKASVQYGDSVKALAVYLSQSQMIPYERVQDFFKSTAGINISTGTVSNFNKEAFFNLEEFEEVGKEEIAKSLVVHADETGIQVDKSKLWIHVASTSRYTILSPHAKRGYKAIEDIGILPNFTSGGTLVTDCWASYQKLEGCQFSLCNAHLIRELKYITDCNQNQSWAFQMSELLIDTLEEVNGTATSSLDKNRYEEISLKYAEILERGLKMNPKKERKEHQERGKTRQSREYNLIKRMFDRQEDVLRFVAQSEVPFTNNMAENDLRMAKVQQKISGTFRSFLGSQIFCRVRSFLLTSRKAKGTKPLEALRNLFGGEWLLAIEK